MRATATTALATKPLVSHAPRPYSLPSRSVSFSASLHDGSKGTQSVWPTSASSGSPSFSRASRFAFSCPASSR